jgi:MFS family permease
LRRLARRARPRTDREKLEAGVLVGLSQTPDELIAARVVQGVAAAAMIPQLPGMVSSIR